MQGVDMVIVGVGAVAVIATVLGVVFYDEAAGIQTISFEEQRLAGALDDSLTGVGTGQHSLDFPLPDNATAAQATITVTFTGQTGQGDDIDFQVWFEGPNSSQSDKVPGSMSLGPNEDSGSTELTLPKFTWYDVPPPTNTTNPQEVDERVQWEDGLQVVIEITRAGDDALAGVIPGVGYTFNVGVAGDLFIYRIATSDLPDPGAI